MSRNGVPGDFFEELGEVYKQRNLDEYWDEEKSVLEDVFPRIVDELADKFQLKEPLDVGGGGVVSVVYDNNIEERRVLKVSRPSLGKVSLLGDLLSAEKQNLLRLSNQNIIRIYDQGEVSHDRNNFPYYIMQFVEGPEGSGIEADDFLADESRTTKEVLDFLHGVLQAIEYLHSQDTVHMDIKPENILVNSNGVPLISDLGFAKHLEIEEQAEQTTRIGGTQGYIHPEVDEYIHVSDSDPNRVRGEVTREKLKERARTWDLYSLGQTFLELLDTIEQNNPNVLNTYQKRYFRLLACRLLDGKNDPDPDNGERALLISVSAYDDIKYSGISQVREDFEKLIGLYNLTAQVPELDLTMQNISRPSTLSEVPFTDRVRRILNDPYVSRLGGFTQLGLLYLVHPSANHTRLEHTIGTFSVVCHYINSLYNDPHNPIFRQIMNKRDVETVLLAALLLDIGQFPLAHDIKEADSSFDDKEIRDRILSESDSNLETIIGEDWSTSLDHVQDLLKADPKLLRGSIKERILKTIIKGPLGADRIDHLLRDSNKIGLSYGNSIDLDQLVDNLTIVLRDSGGDTYASLGIHEAGKLPANPLRSPTMRCSVPFIGITNFGESNRCCTGWSGSVSIPIPGRMPRKSSART